MHEQRRTSSSFRKGLAPAAVRRVLLHLSLIAGACLMLFPFYWMVTTAFKDLTEASRFPPTFWPEKWHPHNFIDAWRAAPFGRYFLNTIVVAVCQTVAVLITSTLAAYGFARLRFPGKDLLFVCFLGTMMVPLEVILVPNFVIVNQLGWYDTYAGLIVPWTVNVFGIFLLRQWFLSMPQELYEAAEMDGCGRYGFLWRIALPNSIPALVTVGLLSFVGAWNSLLWPLIVTGSSEMRTLQVGLAAFQSEAYVEYHLWMAGATLTIAPIIVLYLFAQRFFIEGVSGSGIKG